MQEPPSDAAPLIPARDVRKFERTYAAGDTIFAKGARGSSMFVVVEGLVRIEDARDGAAAVEIARRGPGEFFGEMALVEDGTRGASAVALVTPTRLAEIDRARFMYLVSQQPAFSLAIIRELCRRIPMPDRS
jgi:CRP-like cAMP-binding protein